MLCVRLVELVWVDSGWFGLSFWVVELRVDAMCGCLRSASVPAWNCGAVCGAHCASSWVVCYVRDVYLFCRVACAVPRVSTIRRFSCILPRFDAFRVLSV